jgi:hypothetical protein
MTADPAPTPPDVTPDSPSPPARQPTIVAFVAIVVLVETAMFWFLVPNAEEISALAESQLIESVRQDEAQAARTASDENTVEEFNLGLYGETFSPIDSERNFRVEIDLYGLVRRGNVKKMRAEFDAKEGRLRHAIRMRIRNSELAELKENQLGLLERRIFTTCNHLLDDDLLLGIGFNNYQLTEE